MNQHWSCRLSYPISPPSGLQFWDHIPSITLPIWRDMFWETSTATKLRLSAKDHHQAAYHFKAFPAYITNDSKSSIPDESSSDCVSLSSVTAEQSAISRPSSKFNSTNLTGSVPGHLNSQCVVSLWYHRQVTCHFKTISCLHISIVL